MPKPGKQTILYIDLHLVHEVTSPQAFEGLRLAGRKVRRPELTVATPDHNVPTTDRSLPIADPISQAADRHAAATTAANSASSCTTCTTRSRASSTSSVRSWAITQPGMTIVCGDSHTATHGAFGALAFGIGTSEVEHVLATQTLLQSMPKTLELRVDGQLAPRRHGQGHDSVPHRPDHAPTAAPATVIEYTGEAIRGLIMEERMTVCNMSIEAGARAGMIAPDETTFDYLRGRAVRPARRRFRRGRRPLATAADRCRREVRQVARLQSRRHRAASHLGHESRPGRARQRPRCPIPPTLGDETSKSRPPARSNTWASTAGTPLTDVKLDRVFIGSCTNARIEDLARRRRRRQRPQRRRHASTRWSFPAAAR